MEPTTLEKLGQALDMSPEHPIRKHLITFLQEKIDGTVIGTAAPGQSDTALRYASGKQAMALELFSDFEAIFASNDKMRAEDTGPETT